MSDPDDEGLAAGAGAGPGADSVSDPKRDGDSLEDATPLVTRFDVGPRVASIDARQMRASIGARLFGASVDPVRVGRYTIIKRLGAGGMGVVYAAFDEQLDRKISLKILKERAGGQDASDQLLLEAQALARLSHPNVVQVFEVGRHEGRVFIAMEYVEGQSLRDWNEAAHIDEVLEVFIGAARGLQAAHKKGLIHRDFKPENVIVDEEGRARVLDFGLARGSLDRDQAPSSGSDAPSSLSQSRDSLVVTGTAAGTPAYMAPEQFEILPLTPATDQFAFCVTLWERVVGQRPFSGKTLSAIYASVAGGELDVTGQERLSPALRRVLRRGLSRDPAARWPSMEALIEAIQRVRDRPRRIRRLAAGAGFFALMSVTGAWLMSREVEDPCAGVDEAFAAMWGPARAQQMQARFASLDLPYGADAFTTVSRELEAYAGRWREAQSSACAASVEDEASVREMGMRRGLCLAQRRRSFEEVVRMLSQADEGLVERSVDAVERLPAVEACDASAGLGAWSLPDDPVAREAVEALSTRLARAETATRFFRYEEAAELVEEVIKELDSVRHDPTLARAHLLAGKTYRRMRRSKEASTALSQARRIADRLGDDLLRARALVELVRVVGNDLAQFSEGLEAADDARAALERLGGQPLLLAELEDHVGSIYRRQGRLDEARHHHERARELIEGRLGTDHVSSMSTHRNLGIVAAMAKDYEGADAAFERSLELVRDRVGERHPALARQLLLQANVASLRAQDLAGEERTALARRCEGMLEKVLEVQRSVYGEEDPRLDDAMHNLGVARMLAGDFEAARSPLESALERSSRALRPDHPDVIETKAELGRVLVQVGEYDRAERLLLEVLEVRRRADQSGRQLGRVELSLAERFDRAGDARARRHLKRAREAFGEDLKEVRLTERERFNLIAVRLGVPELGT